MDFHPFPTQNWSRAFCVWIEGIQVCFQPVVALERRIIRGGALRRIRSVTRVSAALVSVFFCLHCTHTRKPEVVSESRFNGADGFSDHSSFESGQASWYGSPDDGFDGRPTASGQIMTSDRLTCAHRTLPLGSFVEVENLDNHRRAILQVNDRGPFIRGRILDVSRRGAAELGFLAQGTAKIRLRPVTREGRPVRRDPSVDKENPYTVQVAALSDGQNLERLAKTLEGTFGPVSFQEAMTQDGKPIRRVHVGTYTRMEDAQKAADEMIKILKDRGVEPFITRRR